MAIDLAEGPNTFESVTNYTISIAKITAPAHLQACHIFDQLDSAQIKYTTRNQNSINIFIRYNQGMQTGPCIE